MLLRILTAVIGIPVLVGLFYVGEWPLLALVAGMGLLAFWEFAQIGLRKGLRISVPLGGAAVLALALWAFLAPADGVYLGAILSGTAIAVLSWQLLRHETHSVADGLMTLAGVLYVGLLIVHLLLLRNLGGGSGWNAGLKWLLFAFLLTWAADTFAYFAGRAFGRRKLAPAISPNKTVEGAAGGAVATLAAGWLLAPLPGLEPWQGLLIAPGVFLLSVLGDLAESALKRYAGVKDSGRLLPGHGGVLDRFDSSLFVLPFVYYVARLFFL